MQIALLTFTCAVCGVALAESVYVAVDTRYTVRVPACRACSAAALVAALDRLPADDPRRQAREGQGR